MEQLDYNLLFRWFVGLGLDDAIWAPDRLHQEPRPAADTGIARSFFRRVVDRATGAHVRRALHGGRHADRSVGQPEEFQRKDGPPPASGGRDFHGQSALERTHASTTDPDAKLYRHDASATRGSPTWGMSSSRIARADCRRHGHCADGYAERTAAQQMLPAAAAAARPRTVGRDKGYDTHGFVAVRAHERHAARRAEQHGPAAVPSTRGRPGTRAMRKPTRPPAHRARFGWLKTVAWIRQGQAARARQGRLAVRLRLCRLQPTPPPTALASRA